MPNPAPMAADCSAVEKLENELKDAVLKKDQLSEWTTQNSNRRKDLEEKIKEIKDNVKALKDDWPTEWDRHRTNHRMVLEKLECVTGPLMCHHGPDAVHRIKQRIARDVLCAMDHLRTSLVDRERDVLTGPLEHAWNLSRRQAGLEKLFYESMSFKNLQDRNARVAELYDAAHALESDRTRVDKHHSGLVEAYALLWIAHALLHHNWQYFESKFDVRPYAFPDRYEYEGQLVALAECHLKAEYVAGEKEACFKDQKSKQVAEQDDLDEREKPGTFRDAVVKAALSLVVPPGQC